MYNIFNDPQQQVAFENDGFTTLKGLLNETEIEELKNIYYQYTKGNVENSIYGMYVSIDEADEQKKLEMMLSIQQFLKPKLGKYLHSIKCHLGSFLVKVPNPHSYTYPHQDWLFIDNEKPDLFSATIWVSLEDIDVSTGSLGFIKGSHKFLNNIIGSPSPEIITATMGHEALLLSYLTFPPVKKGDALIFNNKTVHAAFPNKTDKQRIAAGIGITPEPAVLYHYHLNPNNPKRIFKLTVDEAFFHTYGNDSLRKCYHKKSMPKYTHVVDELDYQPVLFSREEIEQEIIRHGNTTNGLPIEQLFANISFKDKARFAFQYFMQRIFSK
ncbi:MAG: phytanoyl-CoA dioxygenase family protein [Chitinophagales bacterium]|nr:phytanoyl-CoA dioxygenase family protein [Chitinophagales bacterium]